MSTWSIGDLVVTRYHEPGSAPHEVIDWCVSTYPSAAEDPENGGEWTTVRRADGSERTYRPWDLYEYTDSEATR